MEKLNDVQVPGKSSVQRTEGDRSNETPISTSTAAADASDAEQGQCVMCLEREATWVFKSCGHQCVCKPCSRKLKVKTSPVNESKKGRGKGKRSADVSCPL